MMGLAGKQTAAYAGGFVLILLVLLAVAWWLRETFAGLAQAGKNTAQAASNVTQGVEQFTRAPAVIGAAFNPANYSNTTGLRTNPDLSARDDPALPTLHIAATKIDDRVVFGLAKNVYRLRVTDGNGAPVPRANLRGKGASALTNNNAVGFIGSIIGYTNWNGELEVRWQVYTGGFATGADDVLFWADKAGYNESARIEVG